MEKTCTKCGETKPLEEFSRSADSKDGHTHTCKECMRARSRAWHEANRERAIAANKAWREANPKRNAASKRAWYEANKERAAANSRAWYEANRERAKATSKAWYAANRKRRLADGRRKRARPGYKKKFNAQRKRWRKKHSERGKAKAAAYYMDNKDNIRNGVLQRAYDISLTEYNTMLEVQGNGCAICGKTTAEEGKHLAVDHDHETGEVRGILCGDCNRALGLFRDSPEMCRLAMLYLREHRP